MMPAPIDITGQKFGKLTALEPVRTPKGRLWRCRCDCGGEALVYSDNLKSGNSRSCRACCMDGNLNAKKHGHRPKGSPSPTYSSWEAMKRRCTEENRANAKHYAQAGIKYDPRWESFENFLADMGERPAGHTLDRIKNPKGYSKANCRWATPTTQTRNRRIALVFTLNGVTKPIAEWAKDCGISYGAAYARIKRKQPLRPPDASEFRGV